MTFALALLLAAAPPTYQHLPARGGAPEVYFLPSGASTAALLVQFSVASSEPPSLSQQALLVALSINRSLPAAGWQQDLSRVGANVTTAVSEQGIQVAMVAPADALAVLAPRLVAALFRPRLDEAALAEFQKLPPPEAQDASQREAVVAALEPLLSHNMRHDSMITAPVWYPTERLQRYLASYLTPGNATVTLIGGGEAASLQAQVRAYSGGTRKPTHLTEVSNGVRTTLPSPFQLALVGTPLPTMSAVEAASVRVYAQLVRERLTGELRGKGVAYSVDMEMTVGASFQGLLCLVPAFDEAGVDIEPVVRRELGTIGSGSFTSVEFERAKARVEYQQREWNDAPGAHTQALMEFLAMPEWFADEYEGALKGLTQAQFQTTANALLVNERRRFVVNFRPLSPNGRSR